MSNLKIPKPSPKQELFLMADKKYIGYGGARGGGKSWSIRVKAALLCLNYPGIICMIIRKTYPQLRANHINPMIKMLKCRHSDKRQRIANYNDSQKCITFPNGSTIIFKYCDKEKDADSFQGTEVDVMFVDEATHQSESKMEKIAACVRGVNDFPKRIYYTCNPGGEGHAWVKRLFIDRKFKPDEDPEEYMFIQSLVDDNHALMKSNPDYKKQLEKLPPKLRKAWLEGDWNIFEGQFFEDFVDDPKHYKDRKYTHVIKPFDLPKDWKIYRSFDWGYRRPFSCGWWAVDYDGVLYRILELYGWNGTANEGIKWFPDKVFQEIHRVESEHEWLKGKVITGIADPACWDKETGVSIVDTASKYHVYFSKADNSRIPGWMQMHYRMAFDENGYPMMYIFENCKQFIRTIPMLIYDETNVEDLDTDGEDHIADESRYMCMARPIKPRLPEKKDDYDLNPLSMYLGIAKEDLTPERPVFEMEIK